MKTKLVYLSLIIPAFNEAERIGKSLEGILAFLRAQDYQAEVIIVDDGSEDQTPEVIQERFGTNSGVVVHRQPRNLGKGEAVKQGMLLGKGRYLVFSDADLSVPIEMLSDFLACLEKESDIAIGTRQRAGALIEVHQPLHRELMGKIYTRLSNWILRLNISDFTCGFKGFHRDAAKELFSRQRLKRWSFDAEILYLARLKSYRVTEIPVRWRHDRATKVKLCRDALSSFFGLIWIRGNHFMGKYR